MLLFVRSKAQSFEWCAHSPVAIDYCESFLYTVSCNVDICEFIIFIGKGIPPYKHANLCLVSLLFALNIHRVHIQVSDDV